MIKTNGNRRPKALIKKTNVNLESIQILRDFLNTLSLDNLRNYFLNKDQLLSNEQLISILEEKQRKNGKVVMLIASNGKLFDMSLYVIESDAILSLRKGYDKYSDVVELKSDYFFKAGCINYIYILKVKVVILIIQVKFYFSKL